MPVRNVFFSLVHVQNEVIFISFQNSAEFINLLPLVRFGSAVTWHRLLLLTLCGILCASLTACHILECHSGTAQDVIGTIGQAFELRFRQYLTNPSLNVSCERSVKRLIIT